MDTTKPVTFTVTSGQVRATDPCYDRSTWCVCLLTGVRNGKYNAAVDAGKEDPQRPRRLWAVHTDLPWRPDADGLPWEPVKNAVIGVDSGQISFFDEAKYPENDEAAYDRICDITLSQYSWYVKQHGDNGQPRPINYEDVGVVSGTCYGDGSYPLYVLKQGDEIVGFMIDTSPSFEEDDEDDEE